MAFRGVFAAAMVGASMCFAVAVPALAGIGGWFESSTYDPGAKEPLLIQAGHKDKLTKKAFAPSDKLLAPYAKASLGPDVAYLIDAGVNVVRAEDMQVYCQKIVDQLLAQWPGEKPKVRVVIVGEPTYGAFANALGDIQINIGTFNADPNIGVQNKEELALMLGHELGHILLGHIEQNDNLHSASETMEMLASAYITYGALSNSTRNGNQIMLQGDKNVVLQAVLAELVSSSLMGDIITPSFGRKAEYDADKIGIDLARKAGYNVEGSDIQRFIGKHMETLSSLSARMKVLQVAAVAIFLKAKPVDEKSAMGKWLGLFTKLAGTKFIGEAFVEVKDFMADHPKKDERIKEMLDYEQQYYPQAVASGNAPVRKQVKEVRQLVARPPLQRTVISVIEAKHLNDMLIDRGVAILDADESAKKKADAEAKTSLPSACNTQNGSGININFPIDSAPHTWLARAKWFDVSHGCEIKAKADVARGVQTNFANTELLMHLTQDAYGTPQAAQLPAIYDQYNKLIGTDNSFPELAVASALVRHDTETAEKKAAQCLTYKHQTRYPLCAKLLGYNPLDKNTPAKTEAGRKAFAAASIDNSLNSMLHMGQLFE